jgi:hypothetical protein
VYTHGCDAAAYIGNVAPSWSIASTAGWGKTDATNGGSNVPYGNGFSTGTRPLRTTLRARAEANLTHRLPVGGDDAGDVVKLVIDSDEKTLSYAVNGSDLGVAFTGLPNEVRASSSLLSTNSNRGCALTPSTAWRCVRVMLQLRVGVTLYGPGDRVTIVQGDKKTSD